MAQLLHRVHSSVHLSMERPDRRSPQNIQLLHREHSSVHLSMERPDWSPQHVKLLHCVHSSVHLSMERPMHIPAPPFTDKVCMCVYVYVYVCYGGNGASTPKWKPIGLDFMGTLLDYPLPPNQ